MAYNVLTAAEGQHEHLVICNSNVNDCNFTEAPATFKLLNHLLLVLLQCSFHIQVSLVTCAHCFGKVGFKIKKTVEKYLKVGLVFTVIYAEEKLEELTLPAPPRPLVNEGRGGESQRGGVASALTSAGQTHARTHARARSVRPDTAANWLRWCHVVRGRS